MSGDENISLRGAQVLGLPTWRTKLHFFELWVKPQYLFRPALDKEIDDTTA